MSELTNPSDIARETLRLLASRRIAPNPDNYRQHYQEIAGQPDAAAGAERMLQQLAAELRAQPGTARLAGALDKAAGEKNWSQYRAALLDLIEAKSGQGAAAPLWAQLILDLVKQWDARHGGLTTARKRESLERVLGVPGSDAAGLAAKLQNLVKSWSVTALAQTEDTGPAPTEASEAKGGGAPAKGGAAPAAPAPTTAAPAAASGTEAKRTSAPSAAPPAESEATLVQLHELLAQTLEFAVVSQLGHAPDLAEEANALAQAARAATGKEATQKLTSVLRQFWFKLEMRGGEDDQLHQGLLRLLRLLIDNTHDLLSEDQWMRGQVAALREIIAGPLDLGAIAKAESRLKEVVYKQSALKSSLQEAKAALKQLITSFIDRLGELSESTGGYHTRLGGYAQKIRQTDDIRQLNVVLGDLLEDTRSAQLDALRTRDELLAARRQVESAELKVRELESELDKISGLVQEDQLTGVLNRRGLDDAFDREAARAERAGTPLCVSLLDVDNFKQLNDTHGHQAGDDALQHLVRVIKRTMRPSDVLARYGGEEFLLLLPETPQEEAIAVMVRLQRNLTKAFFLHDNERLLITFSAGVALRREAEPQTAVIERADKALYQAKRSGKNRVCAA
jgi:diguanylate cyclase